MPPAARSRTPLLALASLLLLAPGAALAGGPITSGSTVAGSLSGPTFLESWTFSGSAGQRVVIAAVTSGGAVNTNVTLRNPALGVTYTTSLDRSEFLLDATGTWRIDVEDVGLNDAGTYNLTFLNLTAGPLTSGGDADGGPIVSGEIKTGSNATTSDMDAFTFTGTAGNRVLVGAIATAGASYNTTLYLYPPGGGAAEASTFGDRLDVALAATGTYTILVEDQSNDHTGSYSLAMTNVTAGPYTSAGDADGGSLSSAEVRAGQAQAVGDFDVFRFTGVVGQRVVIGALATGGAMNTNLSLYPPGGGAALFSNSSDRAEAQLTASGTWSIVVEDLGQDATGSYSVSFLNLQGGPHTFGADQDSAALASNQIFSGTIGSVVDFDAFTFSGTAGQRVLFSGIATAGASFNTTFYLYPPNGGPLETSTFGDKLDHQLLQSGTYTVVLEDQNLDHTGSYTVSYYNVTAGPFTSVGDPDGGVIGSSEIRSGAIGSVGDFDGFRLSASVGQRLVIGALATSGAINTMVSVYPPFGGAAVASSSSDRVEVQVSATGQWTIVVEDGGQDATGNYSFGYVNLQAGPHVTAGDPDGGALASDGIRSASHQVPLDMDVFTITGNVGDRVVISAVSTSGAPHNTTLYAYPPNGGGLEASTFADRLDFQLAQSGTYAILVEDQNFDHTGNYEVTALNLTTGPYTSSDPDGGPLASAEIRPGGFQAVGDLDAYQFTGALGQRVVIGAVAATGAVNTNVTLYPPGGGAALVATSSDRTEFQLTATGTWTILVEDVGQDATGTYTLGFINLQGGPLSTLADPDGGTVASGGFGSGTTGGPVDFDAFTISGNAGDRVVVTALATAPSPYNTTVYAYPPNGGLTEASTFADRLDFQLLQSGTYTILVEDQNLDHAGSYVVSYQNLTAGPDATVSDPDGGVLASAEILSGQIQAKGDMDVYRFTGSTSQRVVIGAVATSGALNTNVTLYPPGNGAAVVSTSADRFEFQLTHTGTWTLVVDDVGQDTTGSYRVTLMNLQAGPFTTGLDGDGGALDSNVPRSGTVSEIADLEAYRFFGTAGDRVVVAAVASAAPPFNTTLYLYPPSGAAAEASTLADRMDAQLLLTGFHTLLVEDQNLDHTGGYTVSMVNLKAGPLVTAADPDGGQVGAGAFRAGTISGRADFDAYVFYAVPGDTARITAVTTSGTLNTEIVLYAPLVAGPVVFTSLDNVTYPVTGAGYHVVVIEDVGLDDSGGYNFSLAGPLSVVDAPYAGPALLDPSRVVMAAASPNPSAGPSALTFSLPARTTASLRLYDVRGALVRELQDGPLEAGIHRRAWDGRAADGAPAGPGVYFAELRTPGEILRQKLVRLR